MIFKRRGVEHSTELQSLINIRKFPHNASPNYSFTYAKTHTSTHLNKITPFGSYLATQR